jgi:hypothetical protein
MNNFGACLIFSAFALLAPVPAIQGQIATLISHNVTAAYDDGGVLAVGSAGDTFTVTRSGSGYTIYDSTVGL